MSAVLEITQLVNGDVILVEEGEDKRSEPLLRIRFSDEVRDMLGGDLLGVAQVMIDAASQYIDGGQNDEYDQPVSPVDAIVH